jgi:TonB family protein
MAKKKKRSSLKIIWMASAVIALVFIGAAALAVKILVSDDGQKRKRQIQMVTLLNPPPPPKIKEKPPEPEIKKKEELIEPEPEETPPDESPEQSEDDTPAGDDLGLDADGAAGSDAFGLKAKKGGRALLGGGGKGSLLRKYAWYTAILQDEIRKKLKKHLDENGGIPGGKLQTLVKVVLDGDGRIVDFSIIGSSGSHEMDDAVTAVLRVTRINDPPPDGMPKALRLKISSQG